MATRRDTPFERRLAKARKSPAFDRAYRGAREEIDEVDTSIRALLDDLDAAREAAHVSKAALAASVGLPPETVRRLFTADGQNPTAATLVKLAQALGRQIALVPAKGRSPRRSAA